MENEHPKPPVAGIIYGRITYSLVMVGILIAMIGMVMYFVSDGYVAQECLLDALWDGEEAEAIWEECGSGEVVIHGHWYLNMLSHGDGIAMVGIAICCLAAVVGMWGAFIGTIRSGEKLYALFALIVALIMTLSAIGIIQLE